MPRYKAVATVINGPTNAKLTIDGVRTIIDALSGTGIVNSEKNPIPYVYEAAGPAGFKADLTIVMTPIVPLGDPPLDPTNFSKKYVIPEGLLVSDPNGKIPIKRTDPTV